MPRSDHRSADRRRNRCRDPRRSSSPRRRPVAIRALPLEAAGLPRQRFHDLRHCCATLRLEQGEELAVVSRILGHASITTTANVYGHVTDRMLDKAAERTDVILGRVTA